MVAIVNSFGDRAAFCLTGLAVTVQAGRIVDATQRPPSNETVTAAFYRVAAQTGEEPRPGAAAHPGRPHGMAHRFGRCAIISTCSASSRPETGSASGAGRSSPASAWPAACMLRWSIPTGGCRSCCRRRASCVRTCRRTSRTRRCAAASGCRRGSATAGAMAALPACWSQHRRRRDPAGHRPQARRRGWQDRRGRVRPAGCGTHRRHPRCAGRTLAAAGNRYLVGYRAGCWTGARAPAARAGPPERAGPAPATQDQGLNRLDKPRRLCSGPAARPCMVQAR